MNDDRKLLAEHEIRRALRLDIEEVPARLDPALIAAEKATFAFAKKDDDLRRVWSFVRSDFWFSDEVYGLKRAFGALRLLGRRWHPDLPSEEAGALRWLAQRSFSGPDARRAPFSSGIRRA